jgi:hypothetical protein
MTAQHYTGYIKKPIAQSAGNALYRSRTVLRTHQSTLNTYLSGTSTVATVNIAKDQNRNLDRTKSRTITIKQR